MLQMWNTKQFRMHSNSKYSWLIDPTILLLCQYICCLHRRSILNWLLIDEKLFLPIIFFFFARSNLKFIRISMHQILCKIQNLKRFIRCILLWCEIWQKELNWFHWNSFLLPDFAVHFIVYIMTALQFSFRLLKNK